MDVLYMKKKLMNVLYVNKENIQIIMNVQMLKHKIQLQIVLNIIHSNYVQIVKKNSFYLITNVLKKIQKVVKIIYNQVNVKNVKMVLENKITFVLKNVNVIIYYKIVIKMKLIQID